MRTPPVNEHFDIPESLSRARQLLEGTPHLGPQRRSILYSGVNSRNSSAQNSIHFVHGHDTENIIRTSHEQMRAEYRALARSIENSFHEIYQENQLDIPVGLNAQLIEKSGYRGEIDSRFICPISGNIMSNPTCDETDLGTQRQRFEKDFIEHALRQKPQNPLNRQRMYLKDLAPDPALKTEIDTFVKDVLSWLTKNTQIHAELPQATLKPLRLSNASEASSTHEMTASVAQKMTL